MSPSPQKSQASNPMSDIYYMKLGKSQIFKPWLPPSWNADIAVTTFSNLIMKMSETLVLKWFY